MKKILVVGAGNVGAHIINTCLTQNLGADFYLLDVNQELESANILDLKDTLLFAPRSRVQGINARDEVIADMDIVVITAGANQAPGETRCELLNKNTEILGAIAEKLGALKPSAIVLLVTNPVDILTHVAYSLFDLPKSQIFGSGTLLDSARLRWRIAEKLDLSIKNIHGYVLGEHGDSEFVAWSTVKPGQKRFTDAEKQIMEQQIQDQAYEIIKGKGATYFGISAAAASLLGAIIHDTKEIFPVSTTYPHAENDLLRKTPIGIPAVIGAEGIEQIFPLNLTDEETKKLEDSAKKLHDLYDVCPIA